MENIADVKYSGLHSIKDEEDVEELHEHWHRCRDKWLSTKIKKGDAKDGIITEDIPDDGRELRKIKDTMQSTRGPYDEFKSYYALEQVIDLY